MLLTRAISAASVLFNGVVVKLVAVRELVVAVVLVVFGGIHATLLGRSSSVAPEPDDPVPATVWQRVPGARAEHNWMRLFPVSAMR